jgi:hypothetical protein
MQLEKRRLWHPMPRLFQVTRAGEAQQRLAVAERHRKTAIRRVNTLQTSPLPHAFVSLIENREGVIVDDVKEGIFYLRQTKTIDEISNRVRFVIRHLFKDMKN